MSKSKYPASWKSAADCVPANWCDPILTGPDSPLPAGEHTFNPRHIEALLRAVKARIAEWEKDHPTNPDETR